MRSAFIMCCGQQTRWKGIGLKQHLQINGERLIDRTVKLVKALNYYAFVVSAHPHIGHKHLTPKHTSSLIQSIQGILPFAGEGDLILLGDVYYEHLDIPIGGLFGRGREVFAAKLDMFTLQILKHSTATRLVETGLPVWNYSGNLTRDFDTLEDFYETTGATTLPTLPNSVDTP